MARQPATLAALAASLNRSPLDGRRGSSRLNVRGRIRSAVDWVTPTLVCCICVIFGTAMAGTHIGIVIGWGARLLADGVIWVLQILTRALLFVCEHVGKWFGADFQAPIVDVPVHTLGGYLLIAVCLGMLGWTFYDVAIDAIADRPAILCLILVFSVALGAGGPVQEFIGWLATGGQGIGRSSIGRLLPGVG